MGLDVEGRGFRQVQGTAEQARDERDMEMMEGRGMYAGVAEGRRDAGGRTQCRWTGWSSTKTS